MELNLIIQPDRVEIRPGHQPRLIQRSANCGHDASAATVVPKVRKQQSHRHRIDGPAGVEFFGNSLQMFDPKGHSRQPVVSVSYTSRLNQGEAKEIRIPGHNMSQGGALRRYGTTVSLENSPSLTTATPSYGDE